MSHRNAPLTPEGRRRLCDRVDARRPISHVADEAGIHRQTLGKWYARWVQEGEAGLQDRSSRPHHSPNQTPVRVESRVCQLRRELKVGPVQLCGRLAEEGLTVPAFTIYRILVRHGISRLRDLDVTGEDLREPVRRYEYDQPGDLVLSMSRSSAGSRSVAGTGSTPAARPHTGPANEPGTPTTEPGRRPVAGSATCTCTPRSMTTPGWPTPRNSSTRRAPPPPRSGPARSGSSAATGSAGSGGCSPTTEPATGPWSSTPR